MRTTTQSNTPRRSPMSLHPGFHPFPLIFRPEIPAHRSGKLQASQPETPKCDKSQPIDWKKGFQLFGVPGTGNIRMTCAERRSVGSGPVSGNRGGTASTRPRQDVFRIAHSVRARRTAAGELQTPTARAHDGNRCPYANAPEIYGRIRSVIAQELSVPPSLSEAYRLM